MAARLGVDQRGVVEWARTLTERGDFVIVDTETTGLAKNSEIVSIGVVDGTGALLLDSLLKPSLAIPWDATRIYGIGNIEVDKAPRFHEIYPEIARVLNGRVVVAYNVDFDMGLLQAGAKRAKLAPFRPLVDYCAMKMYARFRGVRNPMTGDFQFHKLSVACATMGVDVTSAHTAVGDCRLTLELIRKLATQ